MNQSLDGVFKVDSSTLVFKFPELQSVDFTDLSLLPQALKDWKAGKEINSDIPGISSLTANPDKEHIWLSFVLEDGKVFDLDLSAFQYGLLQPNPFITPVSLTNYEVALNGNFKRLRCNNPDKSSLEQSMVDLANDWCTSLFGKQSREVMEKNIMELLINDNPMIKFILNNIQSPEIKLMFQNEETFWMLRIQEAL